MMFPVEHTKPDAKQDGQLNLLMPTRLQFDDTLSPTKSQPAKQDRQLSHSIVPDQFDDTVKSTNGLRQRQQRRQAEARAAKTDEERKREHL
jgi:hypothetical protein